MLGIKDKSFMAMLTANKYFFHNMETIITL